MVFLLVSLIILAAGAWWLAEERGYDLRRSTTAGAVPEEPRTTPDTPLETDEPTVTSSTPGAESMAVQPTVMPTPGQTAAMPQSIGSGAERAVTPRPAATSALASTPSPTLAPTATPVLRPDERHMDEKRHMLELINAERQRAGAGLVELGDNVAAQIHAESALENCFSSHWGIDGLKPYMRYSLSGGYQANGENGSGLDYCIGAFDGYRANSGIRREIEETMRGWMDSPGHRRNILDPRHRKVNIGIAWDRYNTAMYQHFEGDYVEYEELPAIVNGVLEFSGRTRNGVRFGGAGDLGVQLYHDPPPYRLTPGQVARTYCYDGGRPVASFREPLAGGSFWTTDRYTTSYDPCPDPYDVPADAPAPRSPEEADRLWQQAHAASGSKAGQTVTVPWITASRWTASGTEFEVRAGIGDILDRYGDGVYTLVLWGNLQGERTVISEYSMFHGVVPPDTYQPD